MSNDSPTVPMAFSNPTASDLGVHRSTGLAFAEGVALLGVGAILDYTGLLPFAQLPVHPFLFIVILISAQYGVQGGIIAAMGAVALSHLNGLPARPLDMSHAEYFRLAWADSLSWLLAALTVGTVTSHRGRVLDEQSAKLRKAMLAESLIAAQYHVLAQRTHQLERSLAGLAAIPAAKVETPASNQRNWAKAPRPPRPASRRLNVEDHP